MQRSGRFWLILLAYLAMTLLGFGIPVAVVKGLPIGPLLLIVGAVGGVVLKRRDPVLSAALSLGVIVAIGIVIWWLMTHITPP